VKGNMAPTGGITALDDTKTIATCMHKAGYRTGLIGKYLNGYGEGGKDEPGPRGWHYIPPGWDDWHGLIGTTTYWQYNFAINHNGAVNPQEYGTDRNPMTPVTMTSISLMSWPI